MLESDVCLAEKYISEYSSSCLFGGLPTGKTVGLNTQHLCLGVGLMLH